MATTMHRLQISLPHWQVQFLQERAQRDGVSVAEVIRQLISREVEEGRGASTLDSLLEIAGIAEDRGPVLAGVPISERPELYLEPAHPSKPEKKSSKRRATRA